MKTHTFSIVVGTAACNAGCPHCISKMTLSEMPKHKDINRRRFRTACNIVKQARNGLVNVLLTGKGEPTSFPGQIEEYLEMMNREDFPLVDLQTNGILLNHYYKSGKLLRWADAGLTLVCISICHYNPQINNKLMKIKGDFDFWKAVDQLHEVGLAVRLNCTMLCDGLWNTQHVTELIRQANHAGVEQVTVRDVEVPDIVRPGAEDVARYCRDQKMPRHNPNWLRDYLLTNGGVELLRLPHGASIFDYHGQNISVNNCVTSTTDPNDIRQIIFFPDGRIAYDWKYPGAQIL